MTRADRPLNVLIVTPFGTGGMGGIDRIMDALEAEVRSRHTKVVRTLNLATRRGSSASWPLHFLLALTQLIALILSGKVDLIHINTAADGSAIRKALVARIARLFGTPYVLHLHGSRFRQFWNEIDGFKLRLVNDMFLHARYVLVLGTVWRDLTLSKVPAVASRIIMFPNASAAAADHSRIHVSRTVTSGPKILFLGRIGTRKGVPELVQALDRIRDENWNALIAGDGMVDETRRELKRLGLSDRVTLPGWVDNAQVTALLSSADILVLPSHDENLPMSVIEGMAYGLAIICTPVGAVGDIIIDGETGLLVQVGDVAQLAGAMRMLVSDRRLRLQLGRNAKALHADRLELTPYADRAVAFWIKAANREH